jgi:hypothetical protein
MGMGGRDVGHVDKAMAPNTAGRLTLGHHLQQQFDVFADESSTYDW